MKVGILGGTFDPVHIAHLIMAEEALAQLSLDQVLFIPAGDPWRKSDRAITPADHRLEMLRLAVEGNESFAISDIELRGEGPTYTADTLAALAGERLDDEFVFILGADAFADMPNWHEPHRIVHHAMLAVAARAGELDIQAHLHQIPGLAIGRVLRFDMPRIDISSTDIRDRVRGERSIRYLVPGAVGEYVARHGLYRA